MTNEEIKLLKNFITWQSLPFVDNLFTHEDEIIKKFDEWLKLNIGSDDKMTNEEVLEQQPNRCDNCIHSEEQDGSNCYECVKGIADNFETQPTDADCISRAEVLKLIDYINFRNFRSYENLIAKINDLPSITPKRKKGMWIDIGYSLSKCNCCKLETKSPRYYCPNCGAEMGVEE